MDKCKPLPPGSRAEAALQALDTELTTAATSTLREIVPDGGLAWLMLLATSQGVIQLKKRGLKNACR